MIENLCHFSITLTDPDATAGMGTLEGYWTAPFPLTIVAVSVSPLEDDTGATLDIDDDGTNVITAIDASDANVPGTWGTPGFYGGTNTPVSVAANSKISFDLNNAAVSNNFYVHVWYLAGVAN